MRTHVDAVFPRSGKTLLSWAVTALLLVLGGSLASAEKVKTTRTTKIMKRPGEQEAVVTRVPAGRSLTVIDEKGRWLKVRANGRTGWVARSSVKTASAREVPRNTRRRPFVDGRSTRRGWAGEAPDDRVGADAVDEDDDKPKKKKAKKAKKARRDEDFEDEDDEDFDEDEDEGDDEEMASEDEDCEDEDCEDAAPEEPKERVAFVSVKKAKLLSKPSKKGKSRGRVKKGARVVVLEEKNGWMLVDDGDSSGWVKKTDVYEPGNRPMRTIHLDAGLGFERMAQVFRSQGNTDDSPIANYDVAAAAAAIHAQADMVQKYKANYLLGGELRFDMGKSAPGIRYNDGTNAADIPYTTYDVDLRALAGYDFHHKTGAAAFGRVGYHYGMFAVANVSDFTKNLAHLPSEILAGPTVGVGADLPRITDKLGGSIRADYLVMGKRQQTKGLEDGAVSTVKALWAGAVVNYQWKPSMTLNAAYGYDYSKTVWTGAATGSMRAPGVNGAARLDVTHQLVVGLTKTF